MAQEQAEKPDVVKVLERIVKLYDEGRIFDRLAGRGVNEMNEARTLLASLQPQPAPVEPVKSAGRVRAEAMLFVERNSVNGKWSVRAGDPDGEQRVLSYETSEGDVRLALKGHVNFLANLLDQHAAAEVAKALARASAVPQDAAGAKEGK